MKVKILQLFDYVLLFCVISLITMGILFIYSSGINSEGINTSNEYIKQIVWAGVGLVLMFVVALLDFRRIDRYVPYLYGFLVFILLYTRIFGRYVNGAQLDWLRRLWHSARRILQNHFYLVFGVVFGAQSERKRTAAFCDCDGHSARSARLDFAAA